MKYEALFLDFQGTLAYKDPADEQLIFEAAAAANRPLTWEGLVAAYPAGWAPFETPAGVDHRSVSRDRATFDAERQRGHLRRLRALGFTEGVEELAGRLVAAEGDPATFHLYADTEPALRVLRPLVPRLVVLSNHVWHLEEILQHLGITRWFDGVVASARVGYRKPHPDIFRYALAAAGVAPERALMVGDELGDDYAGAGGVGMEAILLDRVGRYRDGNPRAIPSLLELAPFVRE